MGHKSDKYFFLCTRPYTSGVNCRTPLHVYKHADSARGFANRSHSSDRLLTKKKKKMVRIIPIHRMQYSPDHILQDSGHSGQSYVSAENVQALANPSNQHQQSAVWPSELVHLSSALSFANAEVVRLWQLLTEARQDSMWWQQEHDSLMSAYWNLSAEIQDLQRKYWLLKSRIRFLEHGETSESHDSPGKNS